MLALFLCAYWSVVRDAPAEAACSEEELADEEGIPSSS